MIYICFKKTMHKIPNLFSPANLQKKNNNKKTFHIILSMLPEKKCRRKKELKCVQVNGIFSPEMHSGVEGWKVLDAFHRSIDTTAEAVCNDHTLMSAGFDLALENSCEEFANANLGML